MSDQLHTPTLSGEDPSLFNVSFVFGGWVGEKIPNLPMEV
jgi:hypothetical protein